jgi:signal transduction histidine kinase
MSLHTRLLSGPIGSDARDDRMLERWGTTRSPDEGFAPSALVRRWAMLVRALAIGLPAAALLSGLGGLAVGLDEPTLTGVSLESPGGHVISVDPTSDAWRAGIRVGQLVISQADESDPGGWTLVTADGNLEHGLSESAAAFSRRAGLIPAAIAMLAGLGGLVVASRHRRRAEAVGAVGLAAAAIPFAIIHDPTGGPIIASVALLGTAGWFAHWSSFKIIRAIAVVLAVAICGAALAGRLVGADWTGQVEDFRFDATIVGVLAIGVAGAGLTPASLARRSAALRYLDVAALAAAILLTVAIQQLASPPLVLLVVASAAVLASYRVVRSRARRWIDQVVFAEERERVAIESAESERARLSRELHDDPLQAIAGVILSLERQPDTARERETLRTVASQLRGIATSLHPPVLDDLGLVPAVESLFAETGPVPIELQLENKAGYGRGERPPFEVELASYRIIAEAATNALRHSGCHRILVRGVVSADAVAIDVIDDGRGIHEREVEAALRDGHIGMASMRRRAEAIDAELAHLSGPGTGTTVRLRWIE